MSSNDEHPSAGGPEQPVPDVPDKQVFRWKDDGGALAPEPDLDSTQDDASETSFGGNP